MSDNRADVLFGMVDDDLIELLDSFDQLMSSLVGHNLLTFFIILANMIISLFLVSTEHIAIFILHPQQHNLHNSHSLEPDINLVLDTIQRDSE